MSSFFFSAILLTPVAAGGVFSYYAQSNLAGKGIILILAVCSIVAWTLMLSKYLDLSRMRALNQRYERGLSKEEHLLGLSPEAALKVAVSTSGYYVRTAVSPSLDQIAEFIANG